MLYIVQTGLNSAIHLLWLPAMLAFLSAVNPSLVGVPTLFWCRGCLDLQFDSVSSNELVGGIFSLHVAKQLHVTCGPVASAGMTAFPSAPCFTVALVLYFYVLECFASVCVCVCASCSCSALGGQKTALDPHGWTWIVVSCHVGAGIEPRPSGRAVMRSSSHLFGLLFYSL